MENALQALQHYFGIESFRGLQEHVVRAVLRGEDIICTLPTGAGKSICYTVPFLADKKSVVLVVSPLVSLIQDQVTKLNSRDRVGFNLSSSCESDDESFVFSNEAISSSHPLILFATPEKIAMDSFQRKLVTLNAAREISSFVIDEAHMLGEQGFDFRDSWLRLNFLRETFPSASILCFSATCNDFCQRALKKTLLMRETMVISQVDKKPNLTLNVHFAKRGKRECTCGSAVCTWQREFHLRDHSCGVATSLAEDLRRFSKGEVLLVTNSRKHCQQLHARVCEILPDKIVGLYHGQLDDAVRAEVQERFVSGSIDVLCCTGASFGTGVNMPKLVKVVIFGVPISVYSFIQTMGRGGRAGQPYECDVYASEADIVKQRAIVKGELKKLVGVRKREYAEHFQASFQRMVSVINTAIEREACVLAYVNNLLTDGEQLLDVKFRDLAEFKRLNNKLGATKRARWCNHRKKWYLPLNAYHPSLQRFGAKPREPLPNCGKCCVCQYQQKQASVQPVSRPPSIVPCL